LTQNSPMSPTRAPKKASLALFGGVLALGFCGLPFYFVSNPGVVEKKGGGGALLHLHSLAIDVDRAVPEKSMIATKHILGLAPNRSEIRQYEIFLDELDHLLWNFRSH